MRHFAILAAVSLALGGVSFAHAADAPDTPAPAGVYKTDAGHRYITFSYLHLGMSHPSLRWRDWDATLNWDPAAPEKSTVEAVIDVNSIDTGVDALDKHLKSGDFFNAEKYPTITFKSTGIEKTGEDTGIMTGDLTIKDVTKPVTLNVTFNYGGKNPFGSGYKQGFDATGSLNRSDFGVDRFVPNVGDEIDFVISAEFKSEEADKK